MFGLFTMSGNMHVWKDNYCRGEFTKCERYKRSERGENVPKRLLPNGKMLAILDR
jgi:hypothetical protein